VEELKMDEINIKILTEVRKLLSVRDNWIQGSFARTITGADCEPMESFAVSWDLLGAIAKTMNDEFKHNTKVTEKEINDILSELELQLGTQILKFKGSRMELGTFNDLTNHDDLLYVLDKTIGQYLN
jgi:hypothetical protein